jgi:hypothetical protein
VDWTRFSGPVQALHMELNLKRKAFHPIGGTALTTWFVRNPLPALMPEKGF